MSKKTETQTELALLVAAGATVREAARRLDLSESYCYSMSTDEAFRSMVARLRSFAVERALGRLSDVAARAVEAMIQMAEDTSIDAAVRLRASTTVLEQLKSLDEHFSLNVRIEALEAGPRVIQRVG